MANYQVLSLDTATPQIKAPGTGNGYSFDSGATNLGTWTTSALNLSTPLTLTTALASSSGGTGLTGFTANGVVYASSSSALTTGSALTFDGTYFTASGLRIAGADTANTIYQPTGGLALSTGSASGITFATNLTTRYSIDSTGVAVWSVGGSEQMRLNSTGLGIGTNSPTNKLSVAGGASTPVVAVTFSATAMTVNCQLSNTFSTTFTANVTTAPTISNPSDGQTINWFITQDATGSRTMTWPTSFKWAGGTAGVLSTAANSVDLLVATYRSATGFWYASLSTGFA